MLTRRRFAELMAASAGLAPLGTTRVAAQGLGTDYDVIVVGAGLSGLVAAQRLSALVAEPKILVLEARDRIGGRVWSKDLKSATRDAELGALYLPLSAASEGGWAPVEEFGLNTEALPSNRETLFPSMSALTRAVAKKSLGTVQLNSPVSSVFYREGLVGVSYQNLAFESSVTARRLIITVPPSLLRSGSLRITPELPDEKLRALQSTAPMPAISVAALFAAEDAVLKVPEESWAQEEGATSYRAFRLGQSREVLLEAQFRSARAETLAGQSDEIIAGLALRGFRDVLESVPQPGKALSLDVVDWSNEAYSGGARFTLADGEAARALAEPVQSTIFFAGDATVATEGIPGLVQAYESGVRVAAEVARTLDTDVDTEAPVLELL